MATASLPPPRLFASILRQFVLFHASRDFRARKLFHGRDNGFAGINALPSEFPLGFNVGNLDFAIDLPTVRNVAPANLPARKPSFMVEFRDKLQFCGDKKLPTVNLDMDSCSHGGGSVPWNAGQVKRIFLVFLG